MKRRATPEGQGQEFVPVRVIPSHLSRCWWLLHCGTDTVLQGGDSRFTGIRARLGILRIN